MLVSATKATAIISTMGLALGKAKKITSKMQHMAHWKAPAHCFTWQCQLNLGTSTSA